MASVTGLVFLLLAMTAAHAAEPREDTRFGSDPGNLRMFSYVPERLAPGAALVVVLHGCKQRAADFARDAGWLRARRRRQGRGLIAAGSSGACRWYFHDVFVSPLVVASWGATPNGCFNWFLPEDNVRDRAARRSSIRQMIDTDDWPAFIEPLARFHCRLFRAAR